MCPRDSRLVRGQYALERQRSPLAGLSGNVNRFTGMEAFVCHFLARTDKPGGRCPGKGLRLALHFWAGLQVTLRTWLSISRRLERARESPRPILPIFRETFAEYLFIGVRMLSDKHMGEEVGERAVILSKNRWWLCLSCLTRAHHSPGVKLRSADFSCENLPTWSVYGMKEVRGVGEKGLDLHSQAPKEPGSAMVSTVPGIGVRGPHAPHVSPLTPSLLRQSPNTGDCHHTPHQVVVRSKCHC